MRELAIGEHVGEDALADCGAGLSFIATTIVATRAGEQAIGTLKVGEQVWAYNPTTRKMELKPILHVWISHDNDLVDLTLTHTIKQGKTTTSVSEVIHTNKKHPFLTVEKGFLPVGQIKLGMHVVEANGQLGVITGWKVVPGVKTMYNLTVAHDHTYTVGLGQWIVHNNNLTSCGGADPDELSQAAKEPSQSKNYSQAGRALQKHLGADRWDRSKWLSLLPSGTKNPWSYNEMGESFVDDLITNPDTIWKSGGGHLNGWEGPENDARGAEWIVDAFGKWKFSGFL